MSQIRSVMNSENYDRIFRKESVKIRGHRHNLQKSAYEEYVEGSNKPCKHPPEAHYTHSDNLTVMCLRCGKVINQGELWPTEEDNESI